MWSPSAHTQINYPSLLYFVAYLYRIFFSDVNDHWKTMEGTQSWMLCCHFNKYICRRQTKSIPTLWCSSHIWQWWWVHHYQTFSSFIKFYDFYSIMYTEIDSTISYHSITGSLIMWLANKCQAVCFNKEIKQLKKS